jgi:hypothetical protein
MTISGITIVASIIGAQLSMVTVHLTLLVMATIHFS